MAPLLASESTTFTLDNMGRFLCNTLQEALDSAAQIVGGRTRDFDVIVVGGGTFGCVVAEHLFIADSTRSRRILVLEAGPFVLPEHVQNMPYHGRRAGLARAVDESSGAQLRGLIFAVGGRSLTWGGWSPELLDVELTAWPAVHAARDLRRRRLFRPSEPADRRQGDQRLHLRAAPYRASQAAPRRSESRRQRNRIHLCRSCSIIRRSATPIPANRRLTPALLRDWLDLPATDTTPEPSCATCSSSKRRSRCSPRPCPDSFPPTSSAPYQALIRAARLAEQRGGWRRAGGRRAQAADDRSELPRAGAHHRDAARQLGAGDRRARLAERRLRRHSARAAARRRTERRRDRARHDRDDARRAHYFPAVACRPRRAAHGHEPDRAPALQPRPSACRARRLPPTCRPRSFRACSAPRCW